MSYMTGGVPVAQTQKERRELENLHLTVNEKEAEIIHLRLRMQELQEAVGL